jgi:ABC-type nitrate/sulfonate/bicarbonate transport system substrate-binding protein
MNKKRLTLIITAAILLLLTACSNNSSQKAKADQQQKGKTTLRYQGYTGTVMLSELAEHLGYFDSIQLDWVGNVNGGPQDIQAVATGQIEFGHAFNGAIVKLKASGADIQAVVGSYGTNKKEYMGLYTLEDSEIKTAKDLIGKKVGVNTLGAHAEFAIKDYLKQGGLTEDEIRKVTLVVVPGANAEQTLRQKQVDVVMVNGVSREKMLARGGVSLLVSDYDIYGPFTAGSYVFTSKFIKENPETVEDFTNGIAKAIQWLQATPREEVIATYKEIIAKRDRQETDEAVQYFVDGGIDSKGGLLKEEDYQRWYEWLIDSGELKKGDVNIKELYTNKFNKTKE